MNGTQLTLTTNPSFYNDTKPVDIPPGISTWTWSATAPSTEASYTISVEAYDHFYGSWMEGSAGFTIGQQSTVSSKAGWQQTGLSLQNGDTFKIAYSYGEWTVDYRYFTYVDTSGYPPDIDQQIYQGCKTVPSLPYGTLLGKIGEGPIFFAGKGGTDAGWFKSNATGQLYLRINDNEACHGDNDGEITITVAKEPVNLADTIKPGGTWIEPNDNFFVTEPRLKLAARISDNQGGSGIARVHFTAWWPGINDKVWYVICAAITPKPGTNDVYECEWDLRWVPNGDVRVSLGIFD